MSLFKKPKSKNFRQRSSRHDSDEENNNDEEDKKPVVSVVVQDPVKKRKPTAPPSQPPKPNTAAVGGSASDDHKTKPAVGTLSFEDEDDGETFKVKKSTYSRRLAKQIEKERKKKKTKDVEPQSQTEEYKIEYRPVKLEPKEKTTLIMNGEDMELELGSGDEEDEDEKEKNDPFRKILESGSIPDAAMIHAARKRRQMAREMGDFVTLETENDSGDKSNSRLVRDDDNDRSDDDDDDEGRISFSVTAAPLAKERAREAFLAMSLKDGDDATDEEVDEELERWEQEQIRKGVSIPQVQVPPPENYPSSYMYPEANVFAEPTFTTNTVTASTVKREPPVQSMPAVVSNELPNFTMEGFKQQLRDRLDSQRQVHRAHERERDKLMDDLVTSESHILELEEKAPGVARAFTFYQEMRGYVTDLVECLDEKVTQIGELETAIMSLQKRRAASLVLRRQQDIKDQCEECASIFSKNTTAVANAGTFNREKAAADASRARRAAEREGRRTRRRQAREAKGANVSHYEGMSSDDEEMEIDVTQFNAEKERIRTEVGEVFSDVVEDFHSFSAIKKRFERWKREYPESYQNAYIGLCLPKLFTPLIRLQLLSWYPLEETFEISNFEESGWFESLMFYSYHESITSSDLKEDTDSQLIPLIVERVIILRLTELAETVWDPMSTSQTLRFVSWVQKLTTEYPTVNGKSKKFQDLLQAVVNRMKKTLEDDVYLPPYPKAILEKSAGANAFFQRQYWTCVKLLRNMLSWQGIICDSVLQQLALDGLLNRYLLWAMNNSPSNRDALEKAKIVTATVPRTWVSKKTGDSTIPQLEMFCRYLKASADAVDKNGIIGPYGEKQDTKEGIKEIVKMLVNIGAMDHALGLVNQFSVKDLKGMVGTTI